MMTQNKYQVLLAARTEIDGSAMASSRGENPREISDQDNMAGESLDDEMVLSDDDQTAMNARAKHTDGDGEENFHDPAGFAGPVHSHIEADNLSDEFLAGKVDLVEQMEKSVDAIHDALEHDEPQRP